MVYTPTEWADGAAGNTAITAARLNKAEQGIKGAHDAVAALPAPLVLGTTAGTALAGNTALLKLGTTATTALKGDTPLLKIGATATDAMAGNTVIPAAAAAGTAAQLTTGTDTVQRTWSAKMIADEVARQIAAIPPA